MRKGHVASALRVAALRALLVFGVAHLLPHAAQAHTGGYSAADYGGWWDASVGGILDRTLFFPAASGQLVISISAGPLDTAYSPFFSPVVGTNGRACVSCHQPSQAMSISVDGIRDRWAATQGKDPLFAAIDGADCPNLPVRELQSHSLLLNHGLIRISLPWPPRSVNGEVIRPEFDLHVVADPTGCNLDKQYGLHGAAHGVSVYRRPRTVANLPLGEPLMSDGRESTLWDQARTAIATHLQPTTAPTVEVLTGVVSFERQIQQRFIRDGMPPGNETPVRTREFQESVRRGSELFTRKVLNLSEFRGYPAGAHGTCDSCHNITRPDSSPEPRWVDMGTTNVAWSGTRADLPLFKLVCHGKVARAAGQSPTTVYTSDPGRALITGKCADIGAVATQRLTGLALREPYFVGGLAPTLRDVVDYYDKRLAIAYTEREKDDLTNFLSIL